MTNSADIIIIGAGIAGASLAASLSSDKKILLLEREQQPGYHSTGRSAAVYLPTYGPAVIQALTRASGPFFNSPPQEFFPHELLTARPTIMITKPDDEELVKHERQSGMVDFPIEKVLKILPAIKPDVYPGALIDADTSDIDVDALFQGYLKSAKSNGVQLVLDAGVDAIARNGETWTITCGSDTYSAPVIVNAAGAWVDVIAELAGTKTLAIEPRRRSAALIDVSDTWDISNWPLCVGAGNTFYFRPMSGKLMVSPADETIVEPHDVWADDFKLAEAMELFGEATGHEVTHVEHTWAGLRTFSSDGDPIVGFDQNAAGFFWLAGQGGYGIQTAPAMAMLAASLIETGTVPDDLKALGISADDLSPNRF